MNKQLRDKIEATIKELDMEIGRKKSQYNNLVIDFISDWHLFEDSLINTYVK